MKPQAYNLAMQTRVSSDLPECENTAGETPCPSPDAQTLGAGGVAAPHTCLHRCPLILYVTAIYMLIENF